MLQKAMFQRLDKHFAPEKSLPVQFNPTEMTLNKAQQIAEIPIPGLDMPVLQFVRGQTETLALELFFDTTDAGMDSDAQSVTEKTDAFYQLIKIDRTTHAPPVCRFVWGGSDFPGSHFDGRWATQNRKNGFQCVVESVRQRFTLFSVDGVPLRATLSLALREYKTLQQQIQTIGLESPDHTHAYTVQAGDTLSRIASASYDDATQWRAIALANGIADPQALQPGRVLQIPPIR
jgi:Contractile injection system tube protein/LysM domain